MNVLHFLAVGDTGGIESLCRDYAVNSNNHNIFVIFWGENGVNTKQIRDQGYDAIELKLEEHNFIWCYFKLRKIIQEYDIGAIITHHASPIMHIYMHIFMKKNRRVFSYAHENAINMYRSTEKKGLLLRKNIIKYSLKKSDKVFAISKSVKQSLISYLTIPETKIELIYNGVDIERFKVRSEKLHDTINIAYVGRLIEGKGVQIIIKALSQLPPSLNYKFSIVGDGAYRSNLEQMVDDCKLSDKISFLGTRENVEEILSDSDIFIHVPILDEGFGITVVEGMAGGRICICSKSGGIPEIIEDKTNGFLVEKNDVDGLASTIKYVIDNLKTHEMEKIRQNACESSNQFSIKTYSTKLDSLISSR